MTRIVLPFKNLPTLFVQITGKNGKKRELLATINPASQDVIIPRIDASHLGYEWYESYPDQPGLKDMLPLVGAISVPGIVQVLEFPLVEIRIGPIALKNVKAVSYDIPYQSGVDVVLGASFFSKLRTTIDSEKGQIVLEDFPQTPEDNAG
jgi:hypothetical protein